MKIYAEKYPPGTLEAQQYEDAQLKLVNARPARLLEQIDALEARSKQTLRARLGLKPPTPLQIGVLSDLGQRHAGASSPTTPTSPFEAARAYAQARIAEQDALAAEAASAAARPPAPARSVSAPSTLMGAGTTVARPGALASALRQPSAPNVSPRRVAFASSEPATAAVPELPRVSEEQALPGERVAQSRAHEAWAPRR